MHWPSTYCIPNFKQHSAWLSVIRILDYKMSAPDKYLLCAEWGENYDSGLTVAYLLGRVGAYTRLGIDLLATGHPVPNSGPNFMSLVDKYGPMSTVVHRLS
jgi:hypothetical protein